MPPKQRYGSEHPAAVLPGCPGIQGPSLYPRQLEMQGSPPSFVYKLGICSQAMDFRQIGFRCPKNKSEKASIGGGGLIDLQPREHQWI